MRYSKLIFVFLLTLILVFGSSMGSFATRVDWDYLYLDVEPNDSTGYIVGTDEGWHIDGTSVTLTAFPQEGYAFKYWKVNVHDDGLGEFTYDTPQINFTLVKDTDCVAYFERVYDLTIAIDDPSMGAVGGTSEGSYPFNTQVDLSAIVNDGYRIVEWTFNGTHFSDSTDISFKMPKDDVAIVLVLEEIPWFEITTSVEDEEDWGTVTGAGMYQVGDDVTLTAIPERGYAFSQWTWEWFCEPQVDARCIPPFDPQSETITFPMKECDGHFTAHFYSLGEPYGVRVIPEPEEGGSPVLENDPLPGDDEFDGYYYYGETFTIDPNPSEHWHFLGYDWECVSESEQEISTKVVLESSPYMSTDPDHEFEMNDCNLEIIAYYEEDPFIMATVKYQNQSGGTIRPDDSVKIYLNDPYSITQPNITGYVNPGSVASGVVTDVETELVIIFKYDVPQVITNTVTETIVVTQTVPATTEATTEAVIPEEETPLGAAMIGFNFDEILEPVPVVEETPEELLPVEETPLGDALPQTGQLPADLFYGIGGLVSAMGVYLKRRK